VSEPVPQTHPRNQKIPAKIFSTHTSSNKATPETIFCQPSGVGAKSQFSILKKGG
jgi:hypothetical protein